MEEDWRHHCHAPAIEGLALKFDSMLHIYNYVVYFSCLRFQCSQWCTENLVKGEQAGGLGVSHQPPGNKAVLGAKPSATNGFLHKKHKIHYTFLLKKDIPVPAA